jgi:ABC-2 type transport system ATP-binding protein
MTESTSLPADAPASDAAASISHSSGAENGTPMIEAIGLSKFYGIFAATRDVSFTVNKGEVVAFLGPNGAGKSTTMKMLTGYLSPSAGMAKIAGHDMSHDRLAGSRNLGYLPETGPLYPEMTPYSLLDFFAEARGMNKKTKRDQIEKVVDICALSSVIYKPINKLSKGYRQRVGMAQALIHEPEVLILDEPTSGLDPNQIRGVRQTMRRLGKEKTILLSTHILQEVTAMASRVVMINEGRKVYDGPIDEMDPQQNGLDHVFADLTAHDPVTGAKLGGDEEDSSKPASEEIHDEEMAHEEEMMEEDVAMDDQNEMEGESDA